MASVQQSEEEFFVIDDELWERLVDLTGGTATLCYQCGTCTASCPWGEVRQEPLSVRRFMRRAQIGLQDGGPSLWFCTTCAQCEVYCPRGVNICDVFRSLRTIAWEQRTVEKGLPSLLWSVFWNGNPWTQPPSQRSSWAKNLDIPVFDPTQHEILLYVGCTSSYDKRAQKITLSLVQVLRAANVRFGYLGDEEPCCGESVLSVGHKPYFNEIAKNTMQVFREKGITNLVTISPHCYDVFKNHYPAIIGQEITSSCKHYTQYLAQLLEEGRLELGTPFSSLTDRSAVSGTADKHRKITFQDPCYLGRHNDEYHAPRLVLKAIPGVELIEMENHGQDSLCCGGGGGRMWLETAPGERFSDIRVEEAAKSGANILATACPFCVVCLEDSLKGLGIQDLKVMEVAEIAAASLLL